ncbi:putative nuclease HARBI1 [Prorops nasuta]|uniref:putative nuclease HARBI1 n=1 Tax=Prorops nasuta TaxID=863751 RepID=UPI0034CF199E
MNNLLESALELLEVDEEENLSRAFQVIRIQRRIFRSRKNWFDILNNKEFQERFRLSKDQFLMVLNKIEINLAGNVTSRDEDISPCIKMLVSLRFYATGSFLITCADFCGMSKVSAERTVHKVSPLIAALSNEFIRFPVEPNEILKIQQGNFEKSGFIRVLGAIDCTHIRIQSYGGNNSEAYRNRKSFFSINVQAIANSKLQIMDLVVRSPGSAHDSTIFDNSRIKARFDGGEFKNGLLLGDAGYRNLPYLLTPLQNPTTPAESLYNEAQIRTRCIIERCFGVWKRTFAVFSIGSRFRKVERTLSVIVATEVLHNIRRSSSIQDLDHINVVKEESDNFLHTDERRYLIDNYFQNMIEN